MRVYAGLEVLVADDVVAVGAYGSAFAAGKRGFIFSGQPCGVIDGFNFYEVLIYSTAYAVREDHFVPWVGQTAAVDNEDTRWRRAAQESWEKIHGRE